MSGLGLLRNHFQLFWITGMDGNSRQRHSTYGFIDHGKSYSNYLLGLAHAPKSFFSTLAKGEMSKSKMSIGKPMVVHAFGICQKLVSIYRKRIEGVLTSTMPATCPSIGAQLSKRYA
jgi:hypothetical protein